MNDMTPIQTTLKDWETDQEVRWCPGCGDYAILKAVQRTLPELGADPSNTVFVSGIGCSSRFPYYVESYGFHTIHGRAPAFATGIKLANPELDVWLVTGDGDGMSIGGNHTMHILRRNVNVQILLFNNEIYGLTKGQFSPTSREGTNSPTSPLGSVDRPASPCAFALGSGARFIARGIDVHKNLPDVLKAAHGHRGASFVEIYQNCVVYNDDVFAGFTARDAAAEKQLWLKAGERMLFAGGAKGLDEPGKLIIEKETGTKYIYDANTKKMVWRGVGTATVSDKPSKNNSKIDKAITKMFEHYPPSHN